MVLTEEEIWDIAFSHWHRQRDEQRVTVIEKVCAHAHKSIEREGEFCMDCGMQVGIAQMLQAREWAKRHHSVVSNAYRRQHHWAERINQFLLRDSHIPTDLFAEVVVELQRSRPCTKTKIRLSLRKRGGQKYIEKWLHVYFAVEKDRCPPGLTSENVERLHQLFAVFEDSWNKNKPGTRHSIINYNYLLCRGLQQLGLRQYCKYFPQLKSHQKYASIDAVWRKMCHTMSIAYLKPIVDNSLR